MDPPKKYKRTGATVNRYIACLSHALSFAVKERRLIEIADVLGHKTLAMVKRYSHLVVDHKARVIEEMIAAKGL
jgi:integrase